MKREEMHDLVMGVALVALVYAVYQHTKKAQATAATIAKSDKDAIDTAIASGDTSLPDISIPAPIEVTGNDKDGYTVDTSQTGWLDNMLKGVF